MLWSASTGPNKVKAGELESRLQKVEEDLSINRANRDQLNQAAERTANELEHIQQKGIRLAKSLHVLSDRANKLEAHLKYLQKEKKVKSVAMAHQKSQLAATLSALHRISLMPTTAMLAIPQSPNDTLRSAILLRATVPKLQGEAADLAEELDT
ncbi:MAG: hypothetical protein VX700_00240 [Pseudomonadota bacterium]|nr:hypothetical protein [Pseudomonadota bacterium]